jgi:hypothetical protein
MQEGFLFTFAVTGCTVVAVILLLIVWGVIYGRMNP